MVHEDKELQRMRSGKDGKIKMHKMRYILVSLMSLCAMDMPMHASQAQDQLIAFVDGFLISRALYTVAELNIPDQLLAGPKTAQEIAISLDLNPDAVHRMLRMLAGHGIFEQFADQSFGLNAISELMTTQHPQSLHGFVLHEDPARWQAYSHMKYTVTTGKPAFNHIFGKGYFDYLSENPKLAEQFDRGMAIFSQTENQQVACGLDYSPYATIVDVGGGLGGLLIEIIRKFPAVQGLLFELPHLQDVACNFIADRGMQDQVRFVPGSFLQSQIAGADLYLLKRILHDWDDTTCVQILRHCVAAMPEHAKVVVFDCVVPDGSDFDISKDIDTIMMVIFGGKERTAQDFVLLFDAAGLQLVSMTPIAGTMLYAIEGVKK